MVSKALAPSAAACRPCAARISRRASPHTNRSEMYAHLYSSSACSSGFLVLACVFTEKQCYLGSYLKCGTARYYGNIRHQQQSTATTFTIGANDDGTHQPQHKLFLTLKTLTTPHPPRLTQNPALLFQPGPAMLRPARGTPLRANHAPIPGSQGIPLVSAS